MKISQMIYDVINSDMYHVHMTKIYFFFQQKQISDQFLFIFHLYTASFLSPYFIIKFIPIFFPFLHIDQIELLNRLRIFF